MKDLQEKIWWLEHQIRELTSGRGMRPGKAIRRLFGEAADLKALTSAWTGGEFGVVLSDSKAAFEAGYGQVNSCMQGKGDLCWEAYSPHGVGIALMVRDGVVVARSLIWQSPQGPAYVRCYGYAWFQLQAVLQLAGFRPATLRHIESKIVVTEWRTVTSEIEVTNMVTYIAESRKQSYLDRGYSILKSFNLAGSGMYYHMRLSKPLVVTRREKVEVFRPYVDRSSGGTCNETDE